jgi:hypothetical protein
MQPFLSEQVAFEHRRQLLQAAEQSRLARTARRRSTARLRIRALEPSDIHSLADLYDGLSPRSRFLRFMAPVQNLPATALEHLADIDHVRHEALGAFDRAAWSPPPIGFVHNGARTRPTSP